jgi:uncharacterized protein (TIGR04168 family)
MHATDRPPFRLAVIGDVHGCWTADDAEYFNRGPYDALLCTGDLPRIIGSIPTAKKLSALNIPAFMVPGNHDATSALQFLAELNHSARLADVLGLGQARREAALRRALHPVKLGGYSLDLLPWSGKPLGLLTARPFSMGGDRFYFRAFLKRRFGVSDFNESAAKLCALVDQAPQDLVFLSHNGPAGLGAARDDIWGCDFRPEGGDFGDPDLRIAIEHARVSGRRVHAVVAGHMHHGLKGGGKRKCWQLVRDGTLYVNAARVPRIRFKATGQPRHHIALNIREEGSNADEIWTGFSAE